METAFHKKQNYVFSSEETYVIRQSSHVPGFSVVGQGVAIPNAVAESMVVLVVKRRG